MPMPSRTARPRILTSGSPETASVAGDSVSSGVDPGSWRDCIRACAPRDERSGHLVASPKRTVPFQPCTPAIDRHVLLHSGGPSFDQSRVAGRSTVPSSVEGVWPRWSQIAFDRSDLGYFPWRPLPLQQGQWQFQSLIRRLLRLHLHCYSQLWPAHYLVWISVSSSASH